MKNSKEYSPKVHKLYRSLKHKYPKVQRAAYDEPVDALVYAIISENMSETETQSAIKRFADHFVNWNDLRVSRAEEIIEVLGADTSVTRNIASTLTMALGTVFNKYNMVSLKALTRIGKRPARQVLEEIIDGTSRFVVNFCCLTSLQAHAIPLTRKMTEFLRSNEMVHPTADEQQIEGFLTKQISAENAYEFYALLRRRSEARRAAARKKTTRKTKAAAKTKKKTKKRKTKKNSDS